MQTSTILVLWLLLWLKVAVVGASLLQISNCFSQKKRIKVGYDHNKEGCDHYPGFCI